MSEKFEAWGIVEIMGHNVISGRLSEVSLAGSNLLRVDIPQNIEGEEQFRTEYVGGNSIYRLRVTTEEVARAVADRNGRQEPQYAYGLRMQSPALAAPSHPTTGVGYDPDEESLEDPEDF